MPPESEVVWTSRSELCADLSVFAEKPESLRAQRALTLFARLCGPEQTRTLIGITFDARATWPTRVAAVGGLSRLDASLSLDELRHLLAVAPPCEDDSFELEFGSRRGHGGADWFRCVFGLVRTPAEWDVAVAFLGALSPAARLRVARCVASKTQPELATWLFEKWRDHDRFTLGRLEVGIPALVAYPEARRLALDAWRAASGEERAKRLKRLRFVFKLDRQLCGELLDRPAELREAADALVLPLGLLLEVLGTEELWRRLEAAFRADGGRGAPRALLREWREAQPRIVHLLSDRELAIKWRRYVLFALCGQSLGRAVEWALENFEDEAHRPLVGVVLEELVVDWPERGPPVREAHRDLLHRAIGDRDPVFRHSAFEAMAILEERGTHDPCWRRHAEDLTSDSDPRIALEAHEALARLGDANSENKLVDALRDGPHREIAIDGLAALCRPADAVVFAAAFRQTRGIREFEDSGVAWSLGRAVAKVGTLEALATLIRGYLDSVGGEFLWRLEEDIVALADRILR